MLIHRVDRVPDFLSSRPNWLPHPLTRSKYCPPFGSRGGHTRLREPIWTKGQTLLVNPYTC